MATATAFRTPAKEHQALAKHGRFKAVDAQQGIFSGYLSTFGNVDETQDIVERGAFTQTIKDAEAQRKQRGSKFLWKVLWQHDWNQPIGGILSAKEDSYGLYVTCQLDLDIEEGQRAFSGLKMGYMDAMSIGYDAVQYKFDAQGVRHLTAIRLWEGSIVTFPANPQALIDGSSVKSRRTGVAKQAQSLSPLALTQFAAGMRDLLREESAKSRKADELSQNSKAYQEQRSYIQSIVAPYGGHRPDYSRILKG